MDITAGTVVANHYRIEHPIGRGGMGEVFAATNARTGRRVALKLLRADVRDKKNAIERFKREALAAGRISSDHVTQVLDVEEDLAHGLVIIFELLEGESLVDRLKRTGPIPFEELHPLVEQAFRGLCDAHAAGVVHRDLKPSNVFLERRPSGVRVKLLDFGIAKIPRELTQETLTTAGQSLGTFSFMAPEQIGKAKSVDHRADIYAMATMIFQSLTGQLPYLAKNPLVLVDMKLKTEPRRLSDAMAGPVHPDLEAFVGRGLARDPEARFQSAADAMAAWVALRGATRSAEARPGPGSYPGQAPPPRGGTQALFAADVPGAGGGPGASRPGRTIPTGSPGRPASTSVDPTDSGPTVRVQRRDDRYPGGASQGPRPLATPAHGAPLYPPHGPPPHGPSPHGPSPHGHHPGPNGATGPSSASTSVSSAHGAALRGPAPSGHSFPSSPSLSAYGASSPSLPQVFVPPQHGPAGTEAMRPRDPTRDPTFEAAHAPRPSRAPLVIGFLVFALVGFLLVVAVLQYSSAGKFPWG